MYIPSTRKFWSVGLGHFVTDVLGSSGVVLLTFLSTTLIPMSNTQIGLAVSIRQLTGALSQPVFGLRADRTGGRLLGSGGLALVIGMFALTLVMAAWTQNFYLLLIPFVLQGIGSGAIHPVGALHAAESDDHHVASNTAYFFLMGQIGLAIGPAVVGFMLDFFNPGAAQAGSTADITIAPLFLLALLGLPIVMMIYQGIPSQRGEDAPQKKKKNEEDHEVERLSLSAYIPFIVIALMVILRAMAQPGSVNFLPKLFESKGWSPAEYGLITSFYWVASGVSGVAFGNLADRYDRRLIVMGSMLLSAPAFFFLPIVNGPLAFALAIIGGGFSGGSHSIIVVLAQELIPNSRAFATGAILGFIFGSGAIGTLVIGVLADYLGLGMTFQIVALCAVLSGLMGLLLPKPQRDYN